MAQRAGRVGPGGASGGTPWAPCPGGARGPRPHDQESRVGLWWGRTERSWRPRHPTRPGRVYPPSTRARLFVYRERAPQIVWLSGVVVGLIGLEGPLLIVEVEQLPQRSKLPRPSCKTTKQELDPNKRHERVVPSLRSHLVRIGQGWLRLVHLRLGELNANPRTICNELSTRICNYQVRKEKGKRGNGLVGTEW